MPSEQATSITHLLQRIGDNLGDLDADSLKKDSARTQALEAAKKLVIALETPAEVILQHAFSVRRLVQCINMVPSEFFADSELDTLGIGTSLYEAGD
jgi:hypothetical protein